MVVKKKLNQTTGGTEMTDAPKISQDQLPPQPTIPFIAAAPKRAPPAAPSAAPSQSVGVYRDAGTGKLSGVELPDGRTFLGLSPQQVNEIAASEVAKRQTPAGAVDIGQQNIAQQQQQQQVSQGIQLAQQIGQQPQNPVELAPEKVNVGQAIASGLTTAAPAALGGALTGAITGAAVGGIGAIPGAIGLGLVGGVGGFLQGVRSNIKNQRSEAATTAKLAQADIEQNLRFWITDTNAHPENAADNLGEFNTQLDLMRAKHAKLYAETKSNVNKFVGEDGTPELERYELFYQPGGARDYLVSQMQIALMNPDPSKNFLTNEDLKNYAESQQ
jgi:hypothetical protein